MRSLTVALSSITVCLFICLVTPVDRQPGPSGDISDDLSSQQNLEAGNPDHLNAIADNYGKLSLRFEPNVGQTDPSVQFVTRGPGHTIFLTRTGSVITLRKQNADSKSSSVSAIRMSVNGGNENADVQGLEESPGRTNYLIGNDPSKWRADVPQFAQVRYKEILPGIDMLYYGDGQKLEYDFVVGAGADPNAIGLTLDGSSSTKVDKTTGDLLIETASGTLRQLKPVAYQTISAIRRDVACEYETKDLADGKVSVTIKLGEYDHGQELIIDPVLAYGSYLGGSAFDEGRSITVDDGGNAYIVGTAASLDFPTTTGVLKPTLLPRTDAPNSYWYDAFVTKVNPTGTAVIYSTYFGGRNGSETGTGVAVDPNGNVLISGTTMAADLPIVNAYQPTFGGTDDAFAAKLNASGSSIIYSTYLGGNNTDTGGHIALNRTSGDAVFAGFSSSPNFPTTPGAFKQRLCNDTPGSCNGIFYSGSYVVKLTATGTIVYSTLFDAITNDVTLDAGDDATFAGYVSGVQFPATPGAFQTTNSGGIDGFIAKLNPAGNALLFGTYLGGGLQSDRVNGISLDAEGNMYVTGQTENGAFPVTPGSFDGTFNGGADGFITKLNPAGSALVYSTFFGGVGADQPFAIGLGNDNSVFIAGETLSSATFPLRNSLVGTSGSIFVSHFNSDATALIYSTLLGQGGAYGLAVDSSNNAYATGHTLSVVTTAGAFQPTRGGNDTTSSAKDAFVVKLAPTDENVPSYAISGTVFDDNYGFNNDYSPILVTVSGSANRTLTLSSAANGAPTFFFGDLPSGGNYTVTVHKTGYVVDPQSAVFNDLGANQSADFHILRNQPPEGVITSPIHGTTYNAPASITIQATASDPDGDAIQKVDFIAYNSAAGSIPIGTDTAAPYEVTWNNVPVGTYALYAIPTDSHGLRGISTEVVHIFVVDPTTPTVVITDPTEGQSFGEGEYVTLSAFVSSSINILEFYDQNNNLIGRRIAAPWSTQWRVMDHGNYTITAKGYTSQGQTVTSAPVNIIVNPINHRISGAITDSITSAPVGGVTMNLVCPSNPNISAQTTSDSAGNFVFTDLGTTPNDSVTITPSFAGYTFQPQNRSTGYLGYIVNWNDQNFSAVRTTGITVALTSPSDGQIFTAPASFNLAANATSTAGSITKVDFYRVGASLTLIGSDSTAPYEMPVNGLAVGAYGYFARATDSTGAAADSSVVNITVNQPVSTVRLQGFIYNPGGGPLQGIAVRMTGTINGNPVNQTATSNMFGAYGFFNLPVGGNVTLTPEAPATTFTPPSASFSNVSQDIFDINFTASAANQPPAVQINSPANGAVYTMPAVIPIDVSSSDPDGSVVHLTVSAQGNGVFSTIGQANRGTISFNWQPNLPGNYTIWADALDNGGLHTTTSVNIVLNQPAGVSISGRAVDRNSVGIEGATVQLKNYPAEDTVIATATTDVNGNYLISSISTFNSYSLSVSKPEYSFSPQRRLYFNLSTDQAAVDFTGTLQVQLSDFDGDGGSDLAVWRPSTGVWHISRSIDNGYQSNAFGGGQFGDVVVPGNYDGDKKIDYAVYRSGVWYILKSSNGAVSIVSFGIATDIPIPGDYDGDGKTDIAVWRPGEGNWYILRSSNGSFDVRHFGLSGDVPLAGDYDGDGIADLTIWRPNTGVWYVARSSDNGFVAAAFGMNGDVPLTGDFDGDKKADFTVFRPSTGVWYVLRSSDGDFRYFQWGISTDKPVPGDYDHDGKTDYAVFRGSTGVWYIFRSSNASYLITQFGMNGDVAIPAAFVR